MELGILIQTHEGTRFRWKSHFDLSKQPVGSEIPLGSPVLYKGY